MKDTYRDLVAWQRAMVLVTQVYRATEAFPRREIYGLTNQLRRAAVSVPSNIAEGKGRRSKKEYLQFLFKARGSLFEVETQLEISNNLGYIAADQFVAIKEQSGSVARVLGGLIVAVERQIADDAR
ncbi:MAG: four helix bundle protein [Acidobacteria bacterium]|nr:four helix bundle protein [Acidobacteriota bacterium]MBV9070711.1 four helix bundle protein [Acidobacteriota bacterium]MBV9186914.1 four helix bundle protein [Acidobacteriota bacterium]